MRFRVIRPAPLEFLVVGGFVSAVLSCVAAALAFSDIPDRVVTVAIVVGVYAARGRSLVSASATAIMAWMFLTGFLVNDAGTLTFSPADMVRLGILLATGLLGGAVGMVRGDVGPALGVEHLPEAAMPPHPLDASEGVVKAAPEPDVVAGLEAAQIHTTHMPSSWGARR
ncbi:hypothetical protein ACFYOK_33785 [Microbispora bryophytorum]|uniref:hypothetical protein n=1 Tax=Microbispora bryophytorum TaxID=1460882 RepID=UPI0033F4275B